jgi:phosphoglycolate phosphatase
MSDFPFDLIGFDLDGTLVDSSVDLAAAVNHILAGLGRPPLPLAEVRRHIGGGGRRMLALSLADAGADDSALDAHYAALLAYYAVHLADNTRPFPGLAEALDALAARGVTLAVVTNKAERLAVKLLDALGLSGRFAVIIGGGSVAHGKPAPDPILEMIRRCGGARTAFVGDSSYDIDAARAAGVTSIAVTFGFPDRPPETLGADALIDSYDELIPTLIRLAAQTGR